MGLDLRTVIAMLGLGTVLQLVALLIHFRLNRAYRGAGCWLAWSATVTAGFALMLLRQLPALRTPAVLVQNGLIVFGLSAFYVGLMRFHDARERRALLAGIGAVFLFLHLGFTLLVDAIAVRATSMAVTLSLLSLLAARDLRAARTAATAGSASFVSLVLALQGVFFLWRAVGIVAGGPVREVFDPASFNVAPYVAGFVASTLLTFGVIIMANQRSQTELAHAADELRSLNSGLERRVAERTADLERANRELEAFAYSIAHDLRAPLRAVDGFASLLASEHASALDAEGLRLLGRVRSGAQGMDRLLRDLVEYAHVGSAPLHHEKVGMSALAREVFEDVASADVRHRTRLTIAELPPALGDAALLREALRQLLANAVKYSASRAEPHIDVSAARSTRAVTYRVTDNGVGFDAAHAGRLFGVFERLHAQQGFDGTGIGLAILRRVVERHGGRVWAEGAVDVGAAFSFTLPDTGDDSA